MRRSEKFKWLLASCCIAVTGLVLQGCREEEQDRVLLFDKGSYLGAPDNGLTETQVDELRSRAREQKF